VASFPGVATCPTSAIAYDFYRFDCPEEMVIPTHGAVRLGGDCFIGNVVGSVFAGADALICVLARHAVGDINFAEVVDELLVVEDLVDLFAGRRNDDGA